MDKKAESVQFVVIMSVAFILIGLAFVTFGKQGTITSKATYTQKACYASFDGTLTPAEIGYCCGAIKKSTGCRPHTVASINDELYECNGPQPVVVNRNTISFCE
jgi:hypothetical protein